MGNLIVVDCDAPPYIPDGLEKVAEEDQLHGGVRGQFFVRDLDKVKFYLSLAQQYIGCIESNILMAELTNKPVLPANILDFLLENPHLIPDGWMDIKGLTNFINFWGTIYQGSDGHLYVRFLYFDGRWRDSYRWLDGKWWGLETAALRAL